MHSFLGALALLSIWLIVLWRGLWALANADKRLPLLGAGLLAANRLTRKDKTDGSDTE